MEDPAVRRFAEETEPELEDVRRVRARLEGSLREAPKSAVWGPLAGGLGLGGAVAALMLVLLVDFGPPELSGELMAEAGRTVTEAPVEGLTLHFDGHGTLAGDAAAPRIVWTAGSLHVDVDPDAGLAVRVTTGEATVSVIGTAFDVTRSALGTRVAVDRGRVAVSCKRGEDGDLEAGQSTFCLPPTAAGMLARARALQDKAAPTPQILGAVDDGLGRDPTPPVREELRVVKIEALRDAGRTAEALIEARALAGEADHRAEEVQGLIRQLEAAD